MKYIDTNLISRIINRPVIGHFAIKKLKFMWEQHNFPRIKLAIDDKINIDSIDYNIVKYKLPLSLR